MGYFDNAANQAVPGGGIAKPLMIAAAILLAGRMFGHSSTPASTPAAPQPAAPAPRGGGAMPADVDGGLLGGLGNLVEKFRNGGHADVINSWIGAGQNQPIAPSQLSSTLGQQTISDIAAKAGMSEQELIQQLSHALPGLVDKLTPQGRLPTQAEINHFGR